MSDMKKKLKISSTAYRVLLLLYKLNEKSRTVDELNDIFLEDPAIARLFSKDVILKYISTLRIAGYDIAKPKTSNKYCYVLNKAPVQIELSEKELDALALLKSYIKGFHQKKILKNYFSFIEKIKRYMSEEQVEKLKEQFLFRQEKDIEILNNFNEYADLIKKIEQYIYERQRVEIKYKLPEEGKKSIISQFQRIKYGFNSVSVIFYDLTLNQINSVKINRIKNLKQLPSILEERKTLSPVMFNLKGKLAKVYRPYEREKITDNNSKSGEITVTAYSDDIESLLQRLLKYGKNCEVLYPKLVRNKMANLIKNMLDNYKI